MPPGIHPCRLRQIQLSLIILCQWQKMFNTRNCWPMKTLRRQGRDVEELARANANVLHSSAELNSLTTQTVLYRTPPTCQDAGSLVPSVQGLFTEHVRTYTIISVIYQLYFHLVVDANSHQQNLLALCFCFLASHWTITAHLVHLL